MDYIGRLDLNAVYLHSPLHPYLKRTLKHKL